MDDDVPYRQAPPRQKTLEALTLPAREAELEAHPETSPAAKALYKSGQFKGGAWWLSQPRFPQLRLTHLGCQAALSLRLLLSRASASAARRCGFCQRIVRSSGDELSHCLGCFALQGLRTRRHTLLRDTLGEMLRKVLGSHAVSTSEPPFPGAQLDIQATVGASVKYIDVNIINPASQEYMPQASIGGGTASIKAEANKRARYSAVLAEHGIAESALVPFVIEATGRFGPSALRFLDDVRTAATLASPDRNKDATIDYYVDRIKFLCMESTAKIMHHAWAHLQHLQDLSPTAAMAEAAAEPAEVVDAGAETAAAATDAAPEAPDLPTPTIA
jgi:hypothetical protein